MRLTGAAHDEGLADARTLLAHRRTALSMAAGCLLVVRLAALRPWWTSAIADPTSVAIFVWAAAGERRAWQITDATHWSYGRGDQRECRSRMIRGMVRRIITLGVLAALVIAVPER